MRDEFLGETGDSLSMHDISSRNREPLISEQAPPRERNY